MRVFKCYWLISRLGDVSRFFFRNFQFVRVWTGGTQWSTGLELVEALCLQWSQSHWFRLIVSHLIILKNLIGILMWHKVTNIVIRTQKKGCPFVCFGLHSLQKLICIFWNHSAATKKILELRRFGQDMKSLFYRDFFHHLRNRLQTTFEKGSSFM